MSAVSARLRFPFSLRPLAGAIAATLAVAAPPALAEQLLGDTVVTATRSAANADELPLTATTVSRKAIDDRLPVDEADLFRDDPDVGMARDMRRHGATRVNIRGIEDNRVVQMVDGVRLPDYYDGGGPTNFNKNASGAVMLDFLKQVEIVRGAASSLYGSDAIGGVVGYITLDPSDIVGGDKRFGARVRAGYQGAGDSFSSSAIGAFRGDMVDFLIGYGEINGHETETMGHAGGSSPQRSKANPADSKDRGMLAKMVVRPAAGHRFSATLEGREQEVKTDVMRLSAALPRTTVMTGDDDSRRGRASLEYEHKPDGAFYDRMTARIYHQYADTTNDNYQRRSNTSAACSAMTAGANQCDIYQDFTFTQWTTGANLQFETLLGSGVTHLLTYGLDLMRQEVEESRDATSVNRTNGAVSKTIAGETYPLRDFANGRTDTVGVFLQDEIAGLAGGKLSLTPGIRYDRTELKPHVDALAQPLLTATNSTVKSETFDRFSPKFGALWKIDEVVSAYGQVASGFRAPNYNEVNGAFRNTGVPPGYSILPNSDLKPETSVGVELGLRVRTADARGQVAVFDNRYKDFIERMALNCPGDPKCMPNTWPPMMGNAVTYMSQNLAKVRIYGAEVRGSWDFSPGWRVDGAIAYAHGTDEERDEPLNSIEPLRASFGVGYSVGRWGAEGRIRAASRKDRVDDSAGEYFRTPGYGVTDLAAWFRPTRDTRITVVVNNLFDKKYWLWSDIRQADAYDPAGVDFYSQPGRNLRVAFQADF